MATILSPFQLLELNVISAQDLAPVARKMKTYAVAWVHPERKLSTRVDTTGHNNPTWNDKFVFRVDDEFLYGDTTAVMIEIYALHWFRDIHVGTIRCIVGNLVPQTKTNHHNLQVGMRFVALQVRRPSGRPQGILNIGVALLDSSKRSMPLYSQLNASAVGYRHLMGEEKTTSSNRNKTKEDDKSDANQNALMLIPLAPKPELRRTKSDSSSLVAPNVIPQRKNNTGKAGSMISGMEVEKKHKEGRSKASSMVSASDIVKKEATAKAKTGGKPGSMVNGLGFGALTMDKYDFDALDIPFKKTQNPKLDPKSPSALDTPLNKNPNRKFDHKSPSPLETPLKKTPIHKPDPKSPPHFEAIDTPYKKSPNSKRTSRSPPPRDKDSPFPKFNGMDLSDAPYGNYTFTSPKRSYFQGKARITDSELGPSASEVAAAVAKNRNYRVEETESEIMGSWDYESMEGLQSKLDRWRAEMPRLSDHSDLSSFPTSSVRTGGGKNFDRHARRHTDDGAFTCFGSVCGLEFTIICGGSSGRKRTGPRRLKRSPSVDSLSLL